VDLGDSAEPSSRGLCDVVFLFCSSRHWRATRPSIMSTAAFQSCRNCRREADTLLRYRRRWLPRNGGRMQS